jgi:hypothetical protein
VCLLGLPVLAAQVTAGTGVTVGGEEGATLGAGVRRVVSLGGVGDSALGVKEAT